MSSKWARVRLGDVTRQVRTALSVQPADSYVSLGLRMYGKGVFARDAKLGTEIKGSTLYRVQAGQFVYNRMFASGGSFGLVPPELAHGVVSNEFPIFDTDTNRLLPEYLNLYFAQPTVWAAVETECTGTTKSRLRWKEQSFQAHIVALPPLNEQKRIVDLFGALDNAIEAANSADDQLATARMTWRRKLFGQTESSVMVPLAELATTRLGKMLSSTTATTDPEAPYLRNADVRWGRINNRDLKKMPFSAADRIEFSLVQGDVLVCEGGEIGRCSVLDEDLPGVYFQKAIHRVRCGEALDPYFFQLWMEHMAEDGTLSLFSGSSTIPHLTGEKLRKLPVPVFPLEQQKEAVAFNRAFADSISGHASLAEKLDDLRTELLSALLSGAHRIPVTYDALMGAGSMETVGA